MSVRPWRLSVPLQIPYEAYVAEYYNFFFQNLLEEGKYLCTCFDERDGVFDTFIVSKNNPVFYDPCFIEQVYQLVDLSYGTWGVDLHDWGMMEDENINISEDIPVYLAFDFIDHVLKRKAPIRLSSRDYYTFMAESRGFVKKIPSLRIAYK